MYNLWKVYAPLTVIVFLSVLAVIVRLYSKGTSKNLKEKVMKRYISYFVVYLAFIAQAFLNLYYRQLTSK